MSRYIRVLMSRMEAYNYCMEDEYGFMFINYQKRRVERLWKNFDELLTFG